MMKYGSTEVRDLSMINFRARVEERDPWLDIFLAFDWPEDEELPEGLTDPGALVICSRNGHIAQIVVQDEGCDCEYAFTPNEKERIISYLEETGLLP